MFPFISQKNVVITHSSSVGIFNMEIYDVQQLESDLK